MQVSRVLLAFVQRKLSKPNAQAKRMRTNALMSFKRPQRRPLELVFVYTSNHNELSSTLSSTLTLPVIIHRYAVVICSHRHPFLIW